MITIPTTIVEFSFGTWNRQIQPLAVNSGHWHKTELLILESCWRVKGGWFSTALTNYDSVTALSIRDDRWVIIQERSSKVHAYCMLEWDQHGQKLLIFAKRERSSSSLPNHLLPKSKETIIMKIGRADYFDGSLVLVVWESWEFSWCWDVWHWWSGKGKDRGCCNCCCRSKSIIVGSRRDGFIIYWDCSSFFDWFCIILLPNILCTCTSDWFNCDCCVTRFCNILSVACWDPVK